MATITRVLNQNDKRASEILQISFKSVHDIALEVMPKRTPFICWYNGEILLQEFWKTTIAGPKDVIRFVVPIAGLEIIFYVAVAALAAYAAYTVSQVPDTPESIGESASAYRLEGRYNQVKLGDVVEEHFGYNRTWPSYGASEFSRYKDNDQYQYQLFILGEGVYDTGNVVVQIEDTAIENFSEVNVTIYQAGEIVDAFPDNVITSDEVSYIELFSPNEDDYDGYTGPFTVNDAGTTVTSIEVDIVASGGLILINSDDGKKYTRTAVIDFDYREIDDDGNPVGDWESLLDETLSYKTVDAIRITYDKTVTEGRYEVRGRRTDNKYTDDKYSSSRQELQWGQLRGVAESTKTYPNQVMTIEARATNNLNDTSSNKINVLMTRMLPIYDLETETWSEPVATRSLVWAYCYVLKAFDVADSRIDLEYLVELDAELDAEGIYFDWSFDQESTWQKTLEVIASACRGKPTFRGGKYSIFREGAQTAAKAVFSSANIVTDSDSWTLQFPSYTTYDGVQVEYIDNSTWQEETVDCLIDDDAGENMDVVSLPVKDRDVAYRLGLSLRAKAKYVNEFFTFQTNYDGYIPKLGDLVAVNLPKWGFSGEVESFFGNTVILSEPFDFEDGEEYQIILRKKDGSAWGPYSVTESPTIPNAAMVSSNIPEDDISDGTNYEPAAYLIGTSLEFTKYATITKIDYSENSCTISASLYDARVYAYDSAEAPALGVDNVPVAVPDLPVVENISVTTLPEDPDTYMVVWQPAIGAQYYLLEKSYDGRVWEKVIETSTTTFFIPVADAIAVRVAGINAGQGPFKLWEAVYNLYDNDGSYQLFDDDGSYRLTAKKGT